MSATIRSCVNSAHVSRDEKKQLVAFSLPGREQGLKPGTTYLNEGIGDEHSDNK
jgi:hypothetical protein